MRLRHETLQHAASVTFVCQSPRREGHTAVRRYGECRGRQVELMTLDDEGVASAGATYLQPTRGSSP